MAQEERPTIEKLVTYAKKYGTDQVAETAVECGYGLSQLTSLLIKLDAIDQGNAPRITQRRRKIDLHQVCEARAKKLLGIEDETEPQEAA
jgi:hypothetical protein